MAKTKPCERCGSTTSKRVTTKARAMCIEIDACDRRYAAEQCDVSPVAEIEWTARTLGQRPGETRSETVLRVSKERHRLTLVLQRTREVLQLCTTRDFDAPEDVRVGKIGDEIGFGALMSAASKTWADRLRAGGDPGGSQHTCGPCEVTVQKALAEIDRVLASTVTT